MSGLGTWPPLAVQAALSVSPAERAREILTKHHPGEVKFFHGPGDEVIALDDSRRCQGCEAMGWQPGYIMLWPCDAWNLAVALLSREEGGAR